MADESVARFVDIRALLAKKSFFLFGPRQTGKSWLVRNTPGLAPVFNLLDAETYLQLARAPQTLREACGPGVRFAVIDEVQKLPSLLDEVHLLIEERGMRFLLTGSSARKLRRGGVNLLGGRARTIQLHPLSYQELENRFDLLKAVNNGLLPSIYFSSFPDEDLAAYAGAYLKEEIAAEGLVRNIPAFSRFLEVAAHCNGKMINYAQVSSDAMVARSTVQEYFEILKDTLVGYEVPAFQGSRKRKAIGTSKFYLFDPGVARILQNRNRLRLGSPEFGEAFEHYIFHEIKTFTDYMGAGEMSYWRSTSGYEVDFIVAGKTAVEVKAGKHPGHRDLKGLLALKEEKLLKNYFLVCLDTLPRTVDGISILPWDDFLRRLWAGEITK